MSIQQLSFFFEAIWLSAWITPWLSLSARMFRPVVVPDTIRAGW